MKIADRSVHPITAAVSKAVTRGSDSFATVLASGRSVQSIRNERAFGFSETGILGAPRKLPGESSAQYSSMNRAQKIDLQASAQAKTMYSATSSKVTTPRMRDAVSSQTPTLPDQASMPQSKAKIFRQNIGPVEFAPIQRDEAPTRDRTGAAPLLAKHCGARPERKRVLAVYGPDDALCINVDGIDTKNQNLEELLEAFVLASMEFNMTLRTVSVNNNRFILISDSLRETNPCK